MERRRKVRKNVSRPKTGPDYFVPVKPGRDLFTIVLPDYRAAHLLHTAVAFKDVLSKLCPENDPHVTVLTLDDIGTF